jgi:hypothetical protein
MFYQRSSKNANFKLNDCKFQSTLLVNHLVNSLLCTWKPRLVMLKTNILKPWTQHDTKTIAKIKWTKICTTLFDTILYLYLWKCKWTLSMQTNVIFLHKNAYAF